MEIQWHFIQPERIRLAKKIIININKNQYKYNIMAGSPIPWGFVTLADDAALVAWQVANPTLTILFMQRLNDASVHVVYGTYVSQAPGKFAVCDGFIKDAKTGVYTDTHAGMTNDDLQLWQSDHATYIITDLQRRSDGKVMIVFIILTPTPGP